MRVHCVPTDTVCAADLVHGSPFISKTISTLASGYVASAWADDGTLEAMEDPRARFRVAVQWHPEVGDDPRLFEGFLAVASDYAAERASVAS